MSQAKFPDIEPNISVKLEQSLSLLLSSIALEEFALAHLINAEAEKIKFVLGTLSTDNDLKDKTISISDLLTINQSVNMILKNVINKEMLLQFQLDNVLIILNQNVGSNGS
jgi:hypothetical protein